MFVGLIWETCCWLKCHRLTSDLYFEGTALCYSDNREAGLVLLLLIVLMHLQALDLT